MPSFDLKTYPGFQIQWVTDLLKIIRSLDQDPQTWIDVGANIGNITDCMQAQAGAHDQIWCFEPKRSLQKFLTEKYSMDQRIHIQCCAVSNVSGTIDFYEHRDAKGARSFIKGSPYEGSTAMDYQINYNDFELINVQSVRLDDTVPDTPRIRFIKTDTESADFMVILGAENIIKQHRPIILSEFSGQTGCRIHNYTPKQWYSFFKDLNYRLVSPIMGHDERYILNNFSKYTPDLVDILAVPNEIEL